MIKPLFLRNKAVRSTVITRSITFFPSFPAESATVKAKDREPMCFSSASNLPAKVLSTPDTGCNSSLEPLNSSHAFPPVKDLPLEVGTVNAHHQGVGAPQRLFPGFFGKHVQEPVPALGIKGHQIVSGIHAQTGFLQGAGLAGHVEEHHVGAADGFP